MNILIDELPSKVEILGEEYKINTDFRISILFELLMQDSALTEEEKISQALILYYPEIPKDIEKAINKILWFYRCGKDEPEEKGTRGKGKSIQIYSYEYDSDYIYSAFLSQYNIDLQDISNLHWWKFKALFKGLKEDNEFVKIMQYRSIDLSKIKDKEQKEHYKKMQDLYKIPISEDEKEKLNDIEKALLSGTFNQNLL